MISISIILIVSIGCLIYHYCTRTFNYWRDKDVAGPKPIPFFGNLKESALRRKHIGIIYKEIYDKFPDERVIGIYRMTNPSIIIRDLDIVKQILIKDFDVFPERGIEFSKEGLGDNLFHCDSNTWSALRHRLTPMFTSKKLGNNFHLINEHADRLVNYLEEVTFGEQEQEIHHIFKKYAMASIMAACFGINVDLFNHHYELIENAEYYIFRSTYAAELDMLFPNILRKINSSLYPDSVINFCNEIVRIAITQRDSLPTIRNDLIDTLLVLKEEDEIEGIKGLNKKKVKLKLTDHIMAGQVFIYFAAGFGNNGLSLSYTLYHLAKHQDVQCKLIQEIDYILAKYNGILNYDSIKEMSYLDKVFSETLRMHALTIAIQRSTKKNYKIPGTDLIIEKGTPVIISPYAIHRDRELYPDPDTFDPERFSPENAANRHPCAYLPFGAGPRSCLGRQLAKLQFATAIAKILSKFRVEPSEKTKNIEDYEPMSTLLATKGGIYVNIVPRKK